MATGKLLKPTNSRSFTVTLPAYSSGTTWTNNQQIVSNSNFRTSGFAYTVAPASSSIAEYMNCVIYADDVSTASQMTFHCTTPPTNDLTVNVLMVVVN